MQNNPMVSIVVPCYNMEQYLESFVPLLIGQTYKNLDIIFVDDGNTDCTPRMLDDFASLDNRISVIHQENGGVSRARKAGLQAARGEFFTSVDPDDTMELNYIELLVETAIRTNSDFVYCDYDMVYADHTRPIVYPLNPLTPETYLKAQLAHDMWSCYVNKLIKTSLLRENNITPIPGITIWDDYSVVNACAAYAHKMAYCPHILYHYNQTNVNSVTKRRTRRSLEEPILVLQSLEHHFIKSGMMPKIEDEYQWQCLRSKRWMLTSEYRDFETWRNTWSELNTQEISDSRGLKRQLVKQVVSHHDTLAIVFYWIIKIKNRLKRYF